MENVIKFHLEQPTEHSSGIYKCVFEFRNKSDHFDYKYKVYDKDMLDYNDRSLFTCKLSTIWLIIMVVYNKFIKKLFK